MRNKINFLLAISITAASCTSSRSNGTDAAINTLSNKEQREGWQLLFDGNSIKGWHTYGKTSPAASWKVADGSLYLDTQAAANNKRDGGDLVTNEEYENYHLKLDWKISTNGNSGIIFNVNEDMAKYKNTYETGPEMQVLDNDGHPDAKIHKHRAGDLYDLIASAKETAKPVGEWNTAEIMLNKGKLDFFLNGEKVVSTTMWDEQWNQMVANSKFKTMPGFGQFRKGKIALQDHSDKVWFRNIKIRKL